MNRRALVIWLVLAALVFGFCIGDVLLVSGKPMGPWWALAIAGNVLLAVWMLQRHDARVWRREWDDREKSITQWRRSNGDRVE